MSYCLFCQNRPPGDLHRDYHDEVYGFPARSDQELFERFCLEINQAGLSWDIILKKKDNFIAAFDQFNIPIVAAYTDGKVSELLLNSGIIRNKLKINAVIFNANALLTIQSEFGSFASWLDHHHPKTLENWTVLFKKYFKFVGGEIVKEFLYSTGYLKGAHAETCNAFEKVIQSRPKWIEQ